VQRRFAKAIDNIGICRMPEKSSSNLGVAAPDSIMQGCIRLSIAAPYTGASSGTQQKLNSLKALVGSDEPSSSNGELQWKLASPLQARAACIRFSMAL